jgi:hypothetical protein
MSDEQISEICNVSIPTVARWASGEACPHPLGRKPALDALPKKPRSGSYTRERGYRGEAQFVNFMKDGGHECRRHFMSGMFEKGDVTLVPSCMPDNPLKGQIKRKKAVPEWLELDGHDFTAIRVDRGEWIVVCRAKLFRDALQ